MEKEHDYYVYILTNKWRRVLYTGVTNNLQRRILEHRSGKGRPRTFTGRNNCHYLVYWEHHQYILNAIAREKEIKRWTRKEKEELIASFNPAWKFLNKEIGLDW